MKKGKESLLFAKIFKTDINLKRCYVWNGIAGLINASEAIIVQMIMTRTMSLEDVGIVTIAFATANLLVTVGKFGMRTFQATDTNNKYKFSSYFLSRVMTVIIMGVIALWYAVVGILHNAYSIYKAEIIILICMIYMIESVEDVFWGLYQQKGRLDVGGKIFTIRWSVLLIVFSSAVLVTRNLVLALLGALLASIIVEVALLSVTRMIFDEKPDYKECFPNCLSLLKECFPLFLSSFLNFYVINAAKFAIDFFLTDEVQACYGFVAMPVFVIGLLSSFIYQPILTQMALEWKDGNKKGLWRRIYQQLLIILGLLIICELGAYFVGIQCLSLLYNTDLNAYKEILMILLLGGGMLAIAEFQAIILTIMRCRKEQMAAYMSSAIVASIVSPLLVKEYAVKGAAFSYLLSVSVLVFLLGIFVIKTIALPTKQNRHSC